MKAQPFKFLNNTARIQAMRLKAGREKSRVTTLTKQVRQLQHLVRDSGMVLEEQNKTYRGNQYQTYAKAVKAISDKYTGIAEWGVLQTGNIIDLRAAFIINEGIKVVPTKPNAEAELNWAKEFIKYNDLDAEVAQEFAKEAEIEGKIALKLAPEKVTEIGQDGKEVTTTKISVRYVSWTDKEYTVTTAPQDYLRYLTLSWKPTGKDTLEVLKADKFVYKKFGGRITRPNEAAPKIQKCLTQIDDLDKALRDWREIDRIFASPVLGAECKDAHDVKSTKEALSGKNWKLKKVFISTARLYYAQFDIKGIEALEKEIITLAKMISGATGVPVHFLGFTDILKQLATAKNLMEFVKGSTVKERETWKGAYEEVITKAMIMFNSIENKNMSAGQQLDPSKITVEIPFITEEQWDHLVKVFLPAAIAGKITDEAFTNEIPGFDNDEEAKRRKKKDGAEMEQLRKDAEDLKKELTDRDLEIGGPPV